MLAILSCIQDQHEVRFVIVAGLICILSAATTVLLLRHAREATRRERLNWIALAGVSSGFGIWATHFIAMLGYAPGVIMGYDTFLTLLSLVLVVVTSTLAYATVMHTGRPNTASITLGAILCGSGVSAMHYCGMLGLELPARITWDGTYIVASILASVLPLFPAFHLGLKRHGNVSFAGAAALLALSVVALHFIGMTGLAVIPANLPVHTNFISPRAMAFAVSVISMGLVGLAITVVILVRKTEAVIRASERQFTLLVKGISDYALYILDLKGRVASWNAGAERLKGYTREEALGRQLGSFYTPEDREAGLPERALGIAASTGKFTGEGWRMRRDGTRFWAQVTIELLKDEKGRAIGFAKITRDVTQHKEAQDRINAIGVQRDAALDHMHQGLCLFDAEERLALFNTRFLEMYDLGPEDLRIGMSQDEVIQAARASGLGQSLVPDHLETTRDLVQMSLRDPSLSPVMAEYSDNFIVSIASRLLPDGGWVSTFDDITNQRKSEARIEHMALHDGLTGLPNRTRLNLWLEESIATARHHGRKLAIAVFDLNRFKDINDSFGHAWGDIVLAEIARRLSETLADGEFAARLGGDEFGAGKIYTTNTQLTEFLRRLERCFAEPIEHEGQTLHFGASIGVSTFPDDGIDRETLLNNADLAMYRAKGQIGENVCFYEPSMDESARARRKLASDLRQAVERDELELLYQPQCYLQGGELSGYEALLRWHHPTRGLVSPVEFIPIAEEAGIILPIGEWVLRQACLEATLWDNDLRIAVNLSGIQLVQPDIAQTVTRILLETGLPPRRLELEITETSIISDKARALHNLRQIKALGVAIAMDDFGTGYSSLDTLQSFPFDKIKIDKSFLLQSDSNEQAQAIIRAVLGLGQSLQIPVLAEGVETAGHLDLLVNEGCHEAQGYFLGRPGHAPSRLVAQGSLSSGESPHGPLITATPLGAA
ncbi:MAG: EAL domain-containing protein [Pseudomonadota bacterium]|nr:EAL domain-containing protein [Pseudomonadota bacterium]